MDSVIKVTSDIYETSIPKFYENVAKLLEVEVTEKTRFACTKIDISKNIQDSWFSYYRNLGATDWEIAMTLLQYGPKVDETLPDDFVRVLDGYITEEE